MTKNEIAKLALSHLGGTITNVDTDNSNQAIALRKWFDTARKEFLRLHSWNFASKRSRIKVVYSTITDVNDNSGQVQLECANHGLETGDRIYLKTLGNEKTILGKWYVTRDSSSLFTLDDSEVSTLSTISISSGEFAQIPTFGYDYFVTAPTDLVKVIGLEDVSQEYSYEDGKILLNLDAANLRYVKDETDYTKWPNDCINAFTYLLASYVQQEINGPNSANSPSAELRTVFTRLLKPLIKVIDSRESRLKFRNRESMKHSSVVASRYGSINF